MSLFDRLSAVIGGRSSERQQAIKEIRRAAEAAARGAKANEALRDELHAVRGELKELRKQVAERLQQNSWVLTRAARALESGTPGEVKLSGRTVAVEPATGVEQAWDALDETPAPFSPDADWQALSRCPACAHDDFTVVNRWNKFILLAKAPDATSAHYDYAVCHACGILFVSRRPVAARYRFLLERFGEVTAKRGAQIRISNEVLNPAPLSDSDRERLRQLATPGVFVSEHLGLRRSEHLMPLLRDRFDLSVHTDVIGSMLSPRGWRVLEVRSRTGGILDGLRQAWGAEVYAMPIWESQQFLLREVYGIETSDVIDFDAFAIPFDGRFDLIICNHMLTHVLRPSEFLATITAKLKPGGWLYVHNEPDDAEFLQGKQSMLATLNPLHLQAFDPPSVARALAANGFTAVFQRHQANGTQFTLARQGAAAFEPMTPAARDARIEAYRTAYDRAVLVSDPLVRGRLAGEWPGVVERAVATGIAEFDERGQLRVVGR